MGLEDEPRTSATRSMVDWLLGILGDFEANKIFVDNGR